MIPISDKLTLLAQAQADPTQGCMQMLPVLGLMFLIFWLIVIRPQRKQQMEHSRFLERLKEGDRVITTSGIIGRVVGLDRDVLTLDVGDRTRIRFLRSHVARADDRDSEPASKASDSSDEASESTSSVNRRKKKKGR